MVSGRSALVTTRSAPASRISRIRSSWSARPMPRSRCSGATASRVVFPSGARPERSSRKPATPITRPSESATYHRPTSKSSISGDGTRCMLTVAKTSSIAPRSQGSIAGRILKPIAWIVCLTARRYAPAISRSIRQLRVCSFYPDRLNVYGDRGNLMVLARRCAWRGLGFTLVAADVGDSIDPDAHDLFYIGGGQDRDQRVAGLDLIATKCEALRAAA